MAIFSKMWYTHYTKHCFERTLHRSMMYKWEVPAMTAVIYARYPVHLDAMQCRELVEKNQFDRGIPYHSPEIDCPCSFLL